ncbi:hypothetical protein K443DRAFT_102139 [Laccaria amethystina LaAM-08-1]|uniref:Uncharacterized protein n=1 Tax=Laccaria amethystina LaAM-08-1 TaxID=1095629 RepID=A0A0C9XPM6_9AGAR|nr:hypothetical protein K443DRAFT_102139 [Laccaria amethystina LaAM-08-1]
MLVLQILTAALTISFAKASPVAIDVRNWDSNPAADGAFKRQELAVKSATSSYAEYIPSPTETSLTLRYYQERATCLDQFVWYCSVPAGACLSSIPTIALPINLWSLVPCAIAAVCGSVALVLGALCCNGVIQHCDGNTLSSSISSAKPVTGNVMATLNGGGGRGDAPFSRDTFKAAFNNYLQSHGSDIPGDDDFNGMYDNFLRRAICAFESEGEGDACLLQKVDHDSFNNFLHRQ